MKYHVNDIDSVYGRLGSGGTGLSGDEAKKRFTEYGPNELKETKKRSLLIMFLDQFRDFMILILIAAAVVSGLIGEIVDTLAIIVIVALNAMIGFVQEYRAEKAVKALKKMASPSAVALRDGEQAAIPASELVPGDIVLLEAGMIVPADLRLIETFRLKVDESALTGESVPVEKNSSRLDDELLPLGDRINSAYKGTTVTYGRARAIVTKTGMRTELGKIASLLQQEAEVKTPLQKRLASFGQKLGIAVLAICAVVLITGLLRGEDFLRMFLTSISLAVAAVPEALPAVVTISLAIGAKKMVSQNALIRKLPAVETLGSVTYICSDKTGTLTLNKMTVEEIYVNGQLMKTEDMKTGNSEHEHITPSRTLGLSVSQPYPLLMTALALNNDAAPDKEGVIMGDPTETALYEAADAGGYNKAGLEKRFPRVAEIPFDPDRKCMTTFHRTPEGEIISFTKGALESVIGRSRYLMSAPGGASALGEQGIEGFNTANEKMADKGLRTLAFAMRTWDRLPGDMSPQSVENDLAIIGLAGMMDPPREEVRRAVATCRTAGIKPVMITGDHPLTARNIASRLGMTDDGGMITGPELDRLSLEEFEEQVEKISIYARVAPEQKIKIVKALQDKGEFTAMTGDGVNDAPALKRADIGIAMGVTGTDVSKEASHMILLDDNFATIVKAVREGRRIFDNIRKFIKYTMTSNSGEIWTIFLPPFLGLPIPLLPVHILWINLVTDGLPGLALAAEPAEKMVMQRPPRHPRESIFAHGLGTHIIWTGLLMGLVSVLTQWWFIRAENTHWQTMVFTVLCLSQMGHVLAIRSEKESLFRQGLFSNMPLFGAISLTFALQMSTIYVPFLNTVFKTQPLDPHELFITLFLSCIVFLVVEAEKWLRRKKQLTDNSGFN